MMNELEKKLEELCCDILSDLRPRSIVDRNKFDTLYRLLDEINQELGSKPEIRRNVVNSVMWIIFQINIQTNYATGEKLESLNKELGTLLSSLVYDGLFREVSENRR